ncbi:MAG TPA: VCBS repeat-containing protein [Lacipirellulaceae bacterium]|nr:VCBS repeat-containing protein [Lacipirellulaceae bacterium]
MARLTTRRSWFASRAHSKRNRARSTWALNRSSFRNLQIEPLEDQLLLAADFGDAPKPYPTLLIDNGARHEATGPRLGALVDTEPDGQPTAAANGDDINGADDEDGVAFGTLQVGQVNATVTVNVQNAPLGAKFDAWIDFNRDGNWDQNGEHIFASVPVQDGDNLLTFDVPSNAAIGLTYARFRISSAGDLGVVGPALDGEVEDLAVTLQPPAAASNKFAFAGTIGALGASRVEAADLDGDGDLDLVWSSTNFPNLGVYWSENVGGDFSTKPPHLVDHAADLFSIADLDNDGDLDLVTLESNSTNPTMWWQNDGSGHFVGQALAPASAPAYLRRSSTLVDIDLDGDLDVAGNSAVGPTYLENDGAGHFSVKTPAGFGAVANGVPVDLDRDGDLDSVPLGTSTWIENTSTGFVTRNLPSINGNTITARLVVDVDHDGYLDIVGNTSPQSYLAWLHNNGNGTFTPHYTTFYIDPQLTNAGASGLTAGDVDGDGFVDIVNVRSSAYVEDRGVYWFKNDGAGNFSQQHFSMDTAQNPIQVAYFADIDGDGDLDLIGPSIWDDGQAEVAWYKNVSTGVTVAVSPRSVSESGAQGLTYTFHRTDSVATALTVNFSVLGDASFGSDYTQSGASSFSTLAGTVVFPAGVDTVQVVLTPIDDSQPESSESVVLTIAAGDDYIAEGNASAIGTIVDNEPGDFGDAPCPYPTTLAQNGARHVAVGAMLGSQRDAEADGQPTTGANGDDAAGLNDEDGVHFGDIRAGATDASIVVHVENAPAGAYLDAWIDFNGDGNWGGLMEAICQRVAVHNGDNLITFDVPSSSLPGTTYARFRLSSAGGLSPFGLALDGEVEDYALTIDPPGPALPTFAPAQAIAAGDALDNIVAADFDGDGDVDLAGISNLYNQLAWYENNGQGSFTKHTLDTNADGTSLAAVDIDGDGDMDLVAIVDGYSIRQYVNVGHGSFVASAINYTGDSVLQTITAADLDGDADMDLLIGGSPGSGNLFEWLENKGTDGFAEHFVADKTGNIPSIDVVDLDGDGDLDLVSTSSGFDPRVGWYENDGHAVFTYHTLAAPEYPGRIRAADIDGDGDIDLLVTGTELRVYVNDGAGDFVAHTIANFSISGITVADLDGDGDLDLVASVGGGYSQSLVEYFNDGVGNFASRTVDANATIGDGAPVAADLNGDGVLDLVSAGGVYWYRNLASLPGDYSGDGTVNSGDYVLWRKTEGASVQPYSGADGSGNGIVGSEDYDVWRAHFGQTSTAPAAGSASAASVTSTSVVATDPRVAALVETPIAQTAITTSILNSDEPSPQLILIPAFVPGAKAAVVELKPNVAGMTIKRLESAEAAHQDAALLSWLDELSGSDSRSFRFGSEGMIAVARSATPEEPVAAEALGKALAHGCRLA